MGTVNPVIISTLREEGEHMIRKIYFMVQPIPIIGKTSRFLNYLFRRLLIQWIRNKNASIEVEARRIITDLEISEHKEKYPKRNTNLAFPEAE